jgi:hypothetical protein
MGAASCQRVDRFLARQWKEQIGLAAIILVDCVCVDWRGGFDSQAKRVTGPDTIASRQTNAIPTIGLLECGRDGVVGA